MSSLNTNRAKLIQLITHPKATSSNATRTATDVLAVGGHGFGVGVQIWFHDSAGAIVAGTTMTRISEASLTCVTPALALGVGYIRMQNRDGGMCTRPITII